MTKSRKPRSDSTAQLHRILAGANVEIAPPAHVPLTDADWPFFHDIAAEFAGCDWSRHMLDMAALLARTMALYEAEQRQLHREGMVVARADGSVGPNPRSRAVNGLHSQILAVRRSLGLTGRAKAGSSTSAARQREANRKIEEAYRNGSGRDDLLA